MRSSLRSVRQYTHAPWFPDMAMVLVVMPLLFRIGFAQFLNHARNFADNQDNTYLLVPIFSHLSRVFAQGEFPYWVNSLMSGIAIYNDPDFSPAYPFYFLWLNIFSTPLDAIWAVHWLTVFHLAVLYLASYWMLRCFQLSPLPSLFGASILAFSQNTVSYAGWLTVIATYAWFPAAIGCIVLILDRRHTTLAIAGGIASLGLMTLSSSSQSLIHGLYVIAALLAAYAVRLIWQREFTNSVLVVRDLAIVASGALVIGGPSLFPALINLPNMLRFLGGAPPVTGNQPIPYEGTLIGELSVVDLAGIVLPADVPIVVGCGYVGLSALTFALFALFGRRSSWLVAPLAFLTVYALASAMGSSLGFAALNYHLPFLGMVREPPRHLFVFVLGIASLAAFGFEYLTDAVRRGRHTALAIPHLAVLAVVVLIAVVADLADLPWIGTLPKWLFLSGSALVVALVLGALALPRRLQGLLSASAVVVAVLISLQYPWKNRNLTDNDYLTRTNLQSHQTLAALSEIDPTRSYRVMFESDDLRSAFWSMNASYYDIRSFQAFKNPMPNARQFDEVYQRFDVANYYPLLGGRYYLCRQCDRIPPGHYRFDRDLGAHKLYVADDALPRYTVIGRIAGRYDSAQQFYNQVGAGFDYAHEVYLDRSVPIEGFESLMKPNQPDPVAVLKEEKASPNTLLISASVDRPALLLLNEYFTEAWTATLNGLPVKPIRVNLNQIGVLLREGPNLIAFEYRPMLFVTLRRVQMISVVLGVLVLAWMGARGFRIRLERRKA